MKKWVSILVATIILWGLVASCSAVSGSSDETPITTIENNSISTFPPATSTPVSVNLAEPKFDLSCWTIKPLSGGNEIQGSFVYFSPDSFFLPGATTDSLVVLDAGSMRTRRIDLNYRVHAYDSILVSPDYTKLVDESDNRIFFIDQSGVQKYSLPDDNFLINAYLNDGRVLLEHLWDNSDGYEEGKGLALTYYIFDPTTSAAQKHAAFLPNFQKDKLGNGTLRYSPDMKYVLYRSATSEEGVGFTLFDLKTNKVLWVGPPRDENLAYLVDSHPDWLPNTSVLNLAKMDPVWMPNSNVLGALFLDKTTGQTKYYSISTERDVLQISGFDMRDLIDSVWQGVGTASVIMPPVWSPNGRYLISAGKEKNGDNSLYIWDRQENTVYKPCLPDETSTIEPPAIMRYLDGPSFIVRLPFYAPIFPVGRTFKNYLLDPSQKIIYEIPDISQVGNSPNTSEDGLKILLGWVNWEIP